MIIGIDEAGRGPWAGPLVVAAVGLADESDVKGLTDSKLLRPQEREDLGKLVKQTAAFMRLAWVSANAIDRQGLTASMRQTVADLLKNVSAVNCRVVIDGNIDYAPTAYDSEAIIKADQSIPAVSAASIVAKTARDKYMRRISIKHNGYGLERHMGYGTQLHKERLIQLGPSPIHRLSYRPVKDMI